MKQGATTSCGCYKRPSIPRSKEEIAYAKAAWRKANPDKVKAQKAASYKANPEKARERAKAHYKANAAKKIACATAWNKANPEKAKANKLAWNKDNPEARRVNCQNYRAKKRVNGGVLSVGIQSKLFKLQKGKCPCCNKPLGDNYHLDHIVSIARGGSNTDDNIQLLRAKCNRDKSAIDPIDFMQTRGFLL
jgi:5-methylcytosine-specific restriction endonuclease McrA